MNQIKYKFLNTKRKFNRFMRWLKPSYSQYLVMMLPEDMPKNKWVTMKCDLVGLESHGIVGRYHKTEIFKADMWVDY